MKSVMTTVKSVNICFAESDRDLLQIIHLQEQNHVSVIPPDDFESNGFVTVKHDFNILRKMNDAAPQIVAKNEDGKVVGYALVMLEKFKEDIPALIPMFEMIQKLKINDKMLKDFHYYVMGQICIAEEYRGQGVFKSLYDKHKELYSHRFDFCLTEVSTRNIRSMKAHDKVGFKVLHTFRDQTDEWNILIWNWETPPPEVRA